MHRIAAAAVFAIWTNLASGVAQAGVMLGAHIDKESSATSKIDFIAFESSIGRKLAIDNDHQDWAEFPKVDRVKWDVANGRMTMLSWRIIYHRSNPAEGCATADAITAGTYDAQLERQAAAAKSLRVPILVRFNYEMTGNEENTCFTGFREKLNRRLAGNKYIAAWKHVVDKFRAAGATNVKWVWSPGHKAYEEGIWRMFFPGANYVDWIGVDDYNKADTPASFATNPGILAFYAAASSLGKPLIVAETGAVNDPKQDPDPQTLWLTTARAFLKTHPAIKAFVYWNNGRRFRDVQGYGGTGYELRGPGLAAFKAMANDPYFK